MSSSSSKPKNALMILWFLPNFFAMVSIWAGFMIGDDDENAKVLQAIYFATGFICMSLFCVGSLIKALVDQGQCKSNN